MSIMRRTTSKAVVEYNLTAALDEARRKLLQEANADRLKKPLAFWIVATDRRLPLPLLDHTLGELIEMSLAELLAKPGIGVRKLQTLVVLLDRAARPLPPGGLAPPDDDLPAGDRAKGDRAKGNRAAGNRAAGNRAAGN